MLPQRRVDKMSHVGVKIISLLIIIIVIKNYNIIIVIITNSTITIDELVGVRLTLFTDSLLVQ